MQKLEIFDFYVCATPLSSTVSCSNKEKNMDKDKFLSNYRISDDDFKKSECNWQNLIEIMEAYESKKSSLEKNANYYAECLRYTSKVHSVKMRIKHPEHLIAKIIRLKKDCPKPTITKDNYFKYITDLIGIRVLHLFKEDWTHIHNFILEKWDMKENPTVYYRKGDNLKLFEDNGCKTSLHKFGYRSVHYLIESRPNKTPITVEVQVRTIFEEAWSEIDHVIRYPYETDNILLANYLQIFNRLAGNADEMASYVKFLKDEIYKKEQKFREEIKEKSDTIGKLQDKISQLEIDTADKEELRKELEELRQKEIFSPNLSGVLYDDLINVKGVDLSSNPFIANPNSLGDIYPFGLDQNSHIDSSGAIDFNDPWFKNKKPKENEEK